MDNTNILVILITIFISLCLGSFVNVLILRSPHIFKIKKPFKPWSYILYPKSHCPECLKQISPLFNIPILSFLLLKGKCFYCSKKISIQYPLVEAVIGILFALSLLKFGLRLEFFISCLVCLILVWASLIDFKFFILPNELTISLIIIGLVVNFYDVFIIFNDSIMGAVAGYYSLWLIYKVHFLIKRRHGMGYGDFKLFSALGALFGWQSLPIIGILGSIGGFLLFAFYYFKDKKSLNNMIPFGPCLSLGGIVYLLLFY